jgi:stage III sporulation protein SpoIIIAA
LRKENLKIEDNLEELLQIIPNNLIQALKEGPYELKTLLEVVLDLGRPPEARFPENYYFLSNELVNCKNINYVVDRIGSFGKDNRAGITRTLHRISAIRNRAGDIVGLTCRVGRAIYGTIDIIRDLIETGKSILLLGRPGVGKTTMLREVARVLSDDFKKRVIVVDTSNEIAGDGDIPHPGIGRARRMQVSVPELQHAVMIEAVENHMPEVIVIDEIGIEAEAYAARTIAERGVQLVATAHGNTLENLLMNPTLCDLIGDIHAVTLSDEEAKKRGTQKTVLERKAPPTFEIVIEIQDRNTLVVHDDVALTVDLMLRNMAPQPEVRKRNLQGEIEIIQESNQKEVMRFLETMGDKSSPEKDWSSGKFVKIFPYGISRNRLDKAIQTLKVSAVIVRILRDADLVLSKSQGKNKIENLKEVLENDIPVYTIKSNTIRQMQKFLRDYFHLPEIDVEELALQEAEEGVLKVLRSAEAIELSPQNAYIRRLQHQLAEKNSLKSKSIGQEPHRLVKIYK